MGAGPRRRSTAPARAGLALVLLLTGCSTAVSGSLVAPTAGRAPSVPVAPSAPTAPDGTTPGSRTPTTSPPSSSRGTTSTSPSAPVADDGPQVPRPAAQQAPGGVGTPGIGDDYYPDAGNGGYDVAEYRVVLDYTPETNALRATSTVTLRVTAAEPLRRFNLDLQPSLAVRAVRIGSATATTSRDGSELQITPRSPLPAGSEQTVVIDYQGSPEGIQEGTSGLGDGGWFRTRTGGALAVGEPFSASAWMPVNEHPADPASFTVIATVPQRWKVISAGVPLTTDLPRPAAGRAVFGWTQREPVASYLIPLYVDTFDLVTSRAGEVPLYSAFAAGNTEDRRRDALTVEALPVLAELFGPYPFSATGGIYTDEAIPFALETAGRPVYADWVDDPTVIHELAHQWFGDDVTVSRWRDICLNECFASYAPWLYDERTAPNPAVTQTDERWKEAFAGLGDRDWAIPLVDPGAGREFTSVYTRGPVALHVLRRTIGEQPFSDLLKSWVQEMGGGNATWEQFEAMAEQISGQDLTRLFAVWFRGTAVPGEQDIPEPLRR